jgi:hypothetical protein
MFYTSAYHLTAAHAGQYGIGLAAACDAMKISQRVYFEISSETVPAIISDGKLLERLPGQHQLLGSSLTQEQLGFLASIRCSIWADEYG